MAVALVGGAALGAAFGELLKIVLKATRSCKNFQGTLTRLLNTLISLDPVIQEMQQQNKELGRRKEELQSLLNIMIDGKQLVLECSRIYRLDVVARASYEKKLQELIKSLQTFIASDLQVQAFRDIKEILLNVMKILSRIEKCPCLKAEEDATASSSRPISTPLLQDLNESEPKDQLEFWLSWIENSISSLSAESSTNGIDANEVTHEKKEFIFRGFLSVTVVSAENLPAKDWNGTSDPFVVLTLKKSTSKVEITYETKVVKNCLYPVWNQTFVFDVEDGLNDELVAQVWDKDTFGKDDSVGECTLSLNRVIVKEEYEQSFKLVGAESSYLKLHLKWTHQLIHCDSNFQQPLSNDKELKPVGILKVKLLQAKKLTKTIGKPDPFAVLYMQASDDEGEKSEKIKSDVNPIWNENFKFSVEDVSTEHLIVEVYDSMLFQRAKLIGCAKIRLSELQPRKVKDVWSKLEKSKESEGSKEIQRDNNNGQVHVELLYCPSGTDFTNPFALNYSGVLCVTVKSAEDLPALDFMRKSDPFVVLTLRNAKSKDKIHKTNVVYQNLNPVWNKKYDFAVKDGLNDVVIVEVWDKDPIGKDKMGRCILSLTKVILEGEYTESFELVGAKSGSLNLHLKWNPK